MQAVTAGEPAGNDFETRVARSTKQKYEAKIAAEPTSPAAVWELCIPPTAISSYALVIGIGLLDSSFLEITFQPVSPPPPTERLGDFWDSQK